MTRRVFRYQVPVDDRPHDLTLTSGPLHVAAAWPPEGPAVELWAEHDSGVPARGRRFLVVGTGQPLPAGARWAGTCERTRGGLVWHLYELPDDDPDGGGGGGDVDPAAG
jgi:hypothetical protein